MFKSKVMRLFLVSSFVMILVDGHNLYGHGLHAKVSSEPYRLPRTVFPIFYNLTLLTHLDDIAGFEFTGHVSIEIEVMDSTNEITLHSKDLSIDVEDITLSHGDGFGVDILGTSFDKGYDLFTIHTRFHLSVDTTYSLYIPFEGELKNNSLAYHRESYFDKESQSTHWYAAAFFEPAYARQAFPCFDEPDMKARFAINLGHHQKYTALSNMPKMRSETLRDFPEWVLDQFAVTKTMSTYVVAFTINEFVSRKVPTKNGLPIEVWARRDVIDETEFVCKITPTILEYFEEMFQQYTGPKIDMVLLTAFPDEATAIESWGLITFKESEMLVAPKSVSSVQKRSAALLIAHELAHQWFGNLVTMRWWSDLWLNEGLATLLESFGIQHIYPDALQAPLNDLLHTVSVDHNSTVRAIAAPIENPNEMMAEKFNDISYKKSGLVLRMLHSVLGDASFFSGLRYYLEKHQYDNTDADDLWAAFQIKSNSISVKRFMDPWINQPGFPIVTVTRNYHNSTATIKQRRYLKHENSPEDDSCWWIPVAYTTSLELDFDNVAPKLWLTCDENGRPVDVEFDVLLGPCDWIFFNINWAGYYQVEYDAHNLDLLVDELNGRDFKRIDASNRIVLISNLIERATERSDVTTLLRLLDYWRQEDEYAPFRMLFDFMLLLQEHNVTQLADYKEIVAQKYRDVHQEDIDVSLKDQELENLITAMACEFDVEDSKLKAAKIFEKWMRSSHPDTIDRITMQLRICVYQVAHDNKNENELDFVWDRYINSNQKWETEFLKSIFLGNPNYLLNKMEKYSLTKSAHDGQARDRHLCDQ